VDAEPPQHSIDAPAVLADLATDSEMFRADLETLGERAAAQVKQSAG
jgi:hypothetical protein